MNFGDCFNCYGGLNGKSLDDKAAPIFLEKNFYELIDIPTRKVDNSVSLIQRWKNVQTLQTRLCYFFSLAVLISGLYTRKLAKTLCYYHSAKNAVLIAQCYKDGAVSTVLDELC